MVLLVRTAQATPAATAPAPLSQIKQNGAVKQMFVEGRPFIMLAGELHNSSASSIDYMKPIWDRLVEMHLNTVIGTVSWELLEPEEGKFNFDLVDAQIQEARKRSLRLVLIWFASWKNGESTYAPLWVKANQERFPLQQEKPRAEGRGRIFDSFFGEGRTLPLSPLGEASMLADAKAFRADLPGDWPSGGPVARVMDVWRAGAPSVDLLAPDIYAEDFKGTCALYTRSGNPLFIPEAKDQVGNLFWALGQHSALAWSVFGIEDLGADGQVSKAYGMFGEMLPQLAEWQAAGKVAGLLLEGEDNQVVSLGGYRVTVARPRRRGPAAAAPATAPVVPLPDGGIAFNARAMTADTRPFGLLINTAPEEFLLIGSGLSLSFAVDSPGPSRVAVGTIDEGRYAKGIWVPGRRLNGDEGHPVLGGGGMGVLKIRLYRYESPH